MFCQISRKQPTRLHAAFFNIFHDFIRIHTLFTGNEKAEPARLGGRAGLGKYDFIRIPFQALFQAGKIMTATRGKKKYEKTFPADGGVFAVSTSLGGRELVLKFSVKT